MATGMVVTGGTIKAMLLAPTYTPSREHHWRSDITAHEVTGTGYTAGGKAITLTSTFEPPGGRTIVTRPAVSWTASTFTAAYLAIVNVRGGAASADELLWTEQFPSFTTIASTLPINASTVELLT